ncbi:hypothetical protein H4R35_002583, partial [Dimargaris xerosporica]
MPEPVCVAVLGAGVTGLTAAYVLLDQGFNVTLVADHFHDAGVSGDYASLAAGAHWRTWATVQDKDLQAIETITLAQLYTLAQQYPDCGLMRSESFDYWHDKTVADNTLWFRQLAPKFRTLSANELICGTAYGVCYETLSIDVARYLAWLQQRCVDKGATLVNLPAKLHHIMDIQQHCPEAQFVINCTGLGARSLGGVQDLAVFPVRGQWLLAKVPFELPNINVIGKGEMTLIIPRGNGTVFLGGTNEKFSCFADINKVVVKQGIGLRPQRVGGVRIEREET